MGRTGQISSGSTVYVQTNESAAGAYNLLGAWASHWLYLYYYKSGNAKEKWNIFKLDTSVDDIIRFGDAMYLSNQWYSGQTICPTNDRYFTTTTAEPATLFIVQPPATS